MQVIFEMIFIANLWTGAEHPAFSTNSGGSGKKYWGGGWALIIWEATMAKRNYYRTPKI